MGMATPIVNSTTESSETLKNNENLIFILTSKYFFGTNPKSITHILQKNLLFSKIYKKVFYEQE